MQIEKIANASQFDGKMVSCEEFGHGHINSTFKVTTDTGAEYVLQQINKYVFRNPVRLMANVVAVTEFLRKKVDDPQGVIHSDCQKTCFLTV